jgi:hypothetical protein
MQKEVSHLNRGFDLISDVLAFGRCGTVSQTQPRMPLTAPSFAAGHMML